MGITYVDGTVRNVGSEEQVRFLVDSGAGYTPLPERVWQSGCSRAKSCARVPRIPKQAAEPMVLLRMLTHVPNFVAYCHDPMAYGRT